MKQVYSETNLINKDMQVAYEKYKTKLVEEFYPKNKNKRAKIRFAVAKKAISDFTALHPPPNMIAEIMMVLVETASKYAYEHNNLLEPYYDCIVNNFKRALKFMKKEDMLDDYKPRFEKCMEYSEMYGYSIPDEIKYVFEEYY